jgi:hypothetical protein
MMMHGLANFKKEEFVVSEILTSVLNIWGMCCTYAIYR